MRQNDLFPVKITGIVFLICASIASILYFQPQKQPLKWNNLDKALNDSKNNGKPVLVSFYSRWSKDCKFVNDNIFSDESVKKLLNDKFILAQVSLDDADNKKIAKERFEVHRIPTLIMLNSKSREMRRVSNFATIELFKGWLLDSSFAYINLWSDYEDAKKEAETDKKILLVYVSISSDENFNAGNIFVNSRIQLLIAQDFEATYLSKVNPNDKQIIEKINEDAGNAPNLDATSTKGIPMLNAGGMSDFIALYYEGKVIGTINLNISIFYDPNKLTAILEKVSEGKPQRLMK